MAHRIFLCRRGIVRISHYKNMWDLLRYQNHVCLKEDNGMQLDYEQVYTFGENFVHAIGGRDLIKDG